MFVDFKCENPKCTCFEQEITLSIPYSEVEKQVCLTCKASLKRIWNFGGSIRTSDGYKGQ